MSGNPVKRKISKPIRFHRTGSDTNRLVNQKEIFAHGHVKNIVVGRNNSERGVIGVSVQRADLIPADADLTAVRAQRAGDQPDCGGFAAAAFADDCSLAPGRERHGKVRQHRPALIIGEADVGEGRGCRI